MSETNPVIVQYLQSIKEICPKLTDTELEAVADKVTVSESKKKDFFIQSGETQKTIGFISSGLIRTYYIDEQGNERNVGFFSEGEYATHYPAFISKQPSKYSIQCLEPTTFVHLTFDDLQEIYRLYPNVERYGRLIAEGILIRRQARIESFVFMTAEERYLDFIQNQQNVFNRISISQLCSYLGIERQSLTRIRQKLAYQ
ncbi:Crp/Fnr family transcriptional regulator [Fluviicola sp.]|uniref:Crp/Fnr family transcriptional regulator n=1 Tax=Fluviicola sp. TaxID=1917219 RepID=UPI0031D924BF